MSIAVENPTREAVFGLLQNTALLTALGGRPLLDVHGQ